MANDTNKGPSRGYTTTRITTLAHESLAKEAKRFGVKGIDYLDAAINYFAERGLDPVSTHSREGQLIMQDIKRLGDRVFSYMQEQERTLLNSMLEEMLLTRITLERVLRMNETLLNTYSREQLLHNSDGLSSLRKQNEKLIFEQLSTAKEQAQKQYPGKRKSI